MLRPKVYLVSGKSDMRRGIDGLAALVAEHAESELFKSETMFIFCGTKKDRYKALCWEMDGFTLLYKRIENGKLKWPQEMDEKIVQLSHQQYRWLLEGLSINQPKAVKEATVGHLF